MRSKINVRLRSLVGAKRFDEFRGRYYLRKQGRSNRSAVNACTKPGSVFMAKEVAQLTGRDAAWIDATAAEFRACEAAWVKLSGLRSPNKYSDGYIETLDPAEAFALWALVKHMRPRVVVELGTQFGLSARVWKEALRRYVPDHKLVLCDLEDRRRFIGDDESTFLKGDARISLAKLFAEDQVDILYNDAHPYPLITWSLVEGQKHNVPCFAFHDVGGRELRGGPFRVEFAKFSEEQRLQHATDYELVGHWERQCMADAFDARILTQDFAENDTWRLQIFDSLFGFGAALRKDFAAPA